MIIREWRGYASQSKSADYPRHFRDVVIPELQGIPGFQGAFLCQRPVGGEVEFLVLTRWASMDAVRAFTGADTGRAVVEPGAVAALDSYEKTVWHYEVLEEVSA